MKKINIILLCALLLTAGLLNSCSKGKPYQATAQIVLTNTGGKFVTTNITVNPKDSLTFEFTATASSDMGKLLLKKNSLITDTLLVPAASKNSFSGVKKTVADTIPGDYTYYFNAYDAAGVILGTQSVTVTVAADYMYYTQRVLFVPDTTAKTNKCYYATATGKTYSYSGIGSDAASIDFGFFCDTVKGAKLSLYSLTNNLVSFYDVSAWIQNATVFKYVKSQNMSTLTSGSALRTAGINNLTSGATSKVTSLVQNNVVLFKTAAGKYGAILVAYFSDSTAAHTTYLKLDVKVQK